MDEVDYQFQEWLSCPSCDGDSEVSILAHGADIVLECYDCGSISEYEIGHDVPVSNIDANRIEELSGDD